MSVGGCPVEGQVQGRRKCGIFCLLGRPKVNALHPARCIVVTLRACRVGLMWYVSSVSGCERSVAIWIPNCQKCESYSEWEGVHLMCVVGVEATHQRKRLPFIVLVPVSSNATFINGLALYRLGRMLLCLNRSRATALIRLRTGGWTMLRLGDQDVRLSPPNDSVALVRSAVPNTCGVSLLANGCHGLVLLGAPMGDPRQTALSNPAEPTQGTLTDCARLAQLDVYSASG